MWNTVVRYQRMAQAAATGLLFPPACCLCDEEIEPPGDNLLLCDDCRPAFEPVAGDVCQRCAAPLARGGARGDRCWRCIDERFRFEAIAAIGVYEGPLAMAAKLMKLPQQKALTLTAGRLLAERVAARFGDERFDLVAPIPMHWAKRIRRGVNPAALLAEQVSVALHRPLGGERGWQIAGDLLRWNRWAESQHMLTPTRRRRNLRGACCVSFAYHIKDARVLLIDDTLTTGATANEATRALQNAGASQVAVAVVARGIGR